jgi:hypothetical protein
VGYAAKWARVCNYTPPKKSFSTLTEFCTQVLNWAQQTQAQNLVQMCFDIQQNVSVSFLKQEKSTSTCPFKKVYIQIKK